MTEGKKINFTLSSPRRRESRFREAKNPNRILSYCTVGIFYEKPHISDILSAIVDLFIFSCYNGTFGKSLNNFANRNTPHRRGSLFRSFLGGFMNTPLITMLGCLGTGLLLISVSSIVFGDSIVRLLIPNNKDDRAKGITSTLLAFAVYSLAVLLWIFGIGWYVMASAKPIMEGIFYILTAIAFSATFFSSMTFIFAKMKVNIKRERGELP